MGGYAAATLDCCLAPQLHSASVLAAPGMASVKWTPFPGQFGGWNKLGSGSCHAANLIRSSVPP